MRFLLFPVACDAVTLVAVKFPVIPLINLTASQSGMRILDPCSLFLWKASDGLMIMLLFPEVTSRQPDGSCPCVPPSAV